MSASQGCQNSMPNYDKATPLNCSKKQIFAFAEKLSNEVYKPGASLEPVIARFGGKIEYQAIDEWFSTEDGSLVVEGPRSFVIKVSNFTGPLRNRFTIAHELGHYILHSKMGEHRIQVPRSAGPQDRVEYEANWFAAGFLMPTTQFSTVYTQEGGDISSIAAHFLVSPSSVSYRIADLGLRK